MIAIPNCCLIRAGENYVVDPGVIMQGAPVTGALRKRGIEPHDTKVILTHTHFDHVQALIEFTQRETYVHEIELEAPYTAIEQNKLDMVRIEKLTGEEGEIEPGLRWIRTPGPLERPDLAAGRHRRRPGRDRLGLRRAAARVLREDGAARGLRPRARGAAAPVGADQGARSAHGDPRAQPARRPELSRPRTHDGPASGGLVRYEGRLPGARPSRRALRPRLVQTAGRSYPVRRAGEVSAVTCQTPQFPGKNGHLPLDWLVRYRIIAPRARGRKDRKVAARGLFLHLALLGRATRGDAGAPTGFGRPVGSPFACTRAALPAANRPLLSPAALVSASDAPLRPLHDADPLRLRAVRPRGIRAPGGGRERQDEGEGRRPRPQEGRGAARRRPAGARGRADARRPACLRGGERVDRRAADRDRPRDAHGRGAARRAGRRARRRARARRLARLRDLGRPPWDGHGRSTSSPAGRSPRSRRRSARLRSRCRRTARAPTSSAARASWRWSTWSACGP